MQKDWEDEPSFQPLIEGMKELTPVDSERAFNRLDLLLPADEETGAATMPAMQVYLDAMIELVGRHAQPLAVLCVCVDDSPLLRFFGAEGVRLIGKAVARCLRQETRAHDVVGRIETPGFQGAPAFMVVCPLLDEERAAALGERLRAAMTAQVSDREPPWLTLSIGVATLALDVTSSDELVSRAFDSLRRAQRVGGGRIWRHSDTIRTIVEKLGVENTEFDLPNPEGETGDDL